MTAEKAREQFLSGFTDEYPEALTKRYDMLECLSCGEGQETILAEERETGNKVVIKSYDREHPLFFITEQDSLRNLKHPGIPAFIQEYKDDRQRYIIREYISGQTLMEYAEEYAFCERDIIDVGIWLCEILHYLHTQTPPVIHRDIKPQNIVLKDDGTVCLIDFGISRVFKEEEGADTVFCGTKDYAAPEQYGYMQTGSYSDIYSLGAVLTWMLTEKAVPIQKPVTPLEKVLAKCTAFAPENRFHDAAELEKELKALLSGEPKKERKRKNAVILSVAAVIIILSCIFGIFRYRAGIRFEEPLIEEAVRTMLGKPKGILTEEDLQKVTQIFIVGDKVCASREERITMSDRWFAEGEKRGPISSLKDLEQMPNLEEINIIGEEIQDITPLRNLSAIFELDLGKNNISDLSALEGKERLAFIGFQSNPLTDISVLGSCPMLKSMDLRVAGGGYSGEVLAEMGDFFFLDIANDSDAYRYLDGKTIENLKLGSSGLYDLECIRNTTVKQLYIYYSSIRDISALEGRTDIVYLNMAKSLVEDVSVLLTMPNLETVVMNEDLRDTMEKICAAPDFTVEYQ